MNNPTQDSQSELEFWEGMFGKSTNAKGNAEGYMTYSDFIERLNAYVTTRVKEAERQIEANVRHDIVQLAPPCEHSLRQEVEHKAYCGFINGIWQRWAVDNDMSYKPLTTTTNGKGE
jgi:hypothetical protein